jgi:hypothetical protein
MEGVTTPPPSTTNGSVTTPPPYTSDIPTSSALIAYTNGLYNYCNNYNSKSEIDQAVSQLSSNTSIVNMVNGCNQSDAFCIIEKMKDPSVTTILNNTIPRCFQQMQTLLEGIPNPPIPTYSSVTPSSDVPSVIKQPIDEKSVSSLTKNIRSLLNSLGFSSEVSTGSNGSVISQVTYNQDTDQCNKYNNRIPTNNDNIKCTNRCQIKGFPNASVYYPATDTCY